MARSLAFLGFKGSDGVLGERLTNSSTIAGRNGTRIKKLFMEAYHTIGFRCGRNDARLAYWFKDLVAPMSLRRKQGRYISAYKMLIL